MIDKKTVFILGAGSSVPYGFPSGEGLVRLVCRNLSNEDSTEFETLKYLSNSGLVRGFVNALKFSGKTSVDAFLEHQPKFTDVGRLCIAQALIPFEIKDELFSLDNEENWYKYLLQKLNTSFSEFSNNKISFITYNYDRSLECFLYTSLKNSYPKNETEIIQKLNNIPIIHLHGVLGNLPWQGGESRSYEPDIDYLSIQTGGRNIKIIHDNALNDDEVFKLAHAKIEEAERIYFIGFGYNQINLDRLNIQNKEGRSIFGSAYGLTKLEIKKIISSNDGKFDLDRLGYRALGFIRNYVELD